MDITRPDSIVEEKKHGAAPQREWLKFSLLDFKLGLRMLVKYPGLTVMGGAAMAFAIAISAVGFELLMQLTRPSLPLPGGDRIVALQLWDAAQGSSEGRLLHDVGVWRSDLRSVEDVGVYRTATHNLGLSEGDVASITAARITASAFRVTGVAPLLGRPLIDADEDPRAPAVLAIGERVWRARFGGDPDVVGRIVTLDGEPRTVVGVMPESFGFPLHHEAWIPFPLNVAGYRPLEGPAVGAFGRLADGRTIEQARAELSVAAARTRRDSPGTHEHLDARVVPYAESWDEPDALLLAWFGNSFMLAFLLLVYANVALLMFARAATRESELVVRSALGASRRRIVVQLFTEALVLGALGAVIGIATARFGMAWGFDFLRDNRVALPFWFHEGLSPLTLLYAVGLTLLAAAVAGVMPALKVTRGIGTQLRAATAGGGGLRFGRGWTVVIVAQVAFTAAFFPLLIGMGVHAHGVRAVELGVRADEYLAAELLFSAPPPDGAEPARSAEAVALELKRRVAAQPGVRAVTFAQHLPGTPHPAPAIEVEGVPTLTAAGTRLRAQRGTVGVDYFDAMDVPVRSGRNFRPDDVEFDAPVVIVNESFVRDVLGGRNAVGRRLRYFGMADGVEQPGPWHEIVGVVPDVAMDFDADLHEARGIYEPLSLQGKAGIRMAVHLDRDPVAFGPRLRALAAATDPALRLENVRPLDAVVRSYLDAVTTGLRIMLAAGAVALMLSLAGIFSIMSFTVARRTREIGIRVALGSGPVRIVTTMLSRALAQVAVGIVTGLALFLSVMSGSLAGSALRWWDNVAFVVAYALLLACVCLLACVVPARRALAVQPTEALNADA
jgi:predicted permease